MIVVGLFEPVLTGPAAKRPATGASQQNYHLEVKSPTGKVDWIIRSAKIKLT